MKMAKERKMVIHDITIAYQDHVDGKRTSELSLLRGTIGCQYEIIRFQTF